MPQFKSKLLGFKLDPAWSVHFRRDMERLTRQAAREWLRSVIVGVPVWSGMALGSIKLARGPGGSLARFLNVQVPINPINTTGKTFLSPTTGKKVHLDKSKTPEAGGLKAKYQFTFTGKTFAFEFSSTVPHFMHNEFFERTDPGAAGQQIEAPWHSLERARGAFNGYIRHEIKAGRFARIQKYVLRTSVESLAESFPNQGSTVKETHER